LALQAFDFAGADFVLNRLTFKWDGVVAGSCVLAHLEPEADRGEFVK
jgi:hypothetical protein